MLHGHGRLQWPDGASYLGEFQFNKLTGEGLYEWPDGSSYKGQVLDALRSGFGIFTKDGVIYEGNWSKGLRHGSGVLTHKSGTCYKGEFKYGHKQGKGRIEYPNGNFYDGEWANDKKNGAGTMFWKTNGEKYAGEWKNNLQNGFGMHLWLEERGEGKYLRNRYEGFWVDGVREGYGVFYYANGAKYEGEWKGNLKHGFARFTEDSGEVKFCGFVNDKNPQQQAVLLENNVNMGNSIQLEGVENETMEENKRDITILGDKSLNIEIIDGASIIKSEIVGDSNSKITKTDGVSLEKGDKSPRKGLGKKKDQPETVKPVKKAIVEINIFYKLMNMTDIFKESNDTSVVAIMKNATNMLLRHNPALKKYYKYYAGVGVVFDENTFETEVHFALTLQKFWKMMRDIRIMTPRLSLSTINRLILQGAKSNYSMKTPQDHLVKKLDLLKNNENLRNFSDEELVKSKKIDFFEDFLQIFFSIFSQFF